MIVAEIPSIREPEHRYILRVLLQEFLGLPCRIVEAPIDVIVLHVEGEESGSVTLNDDFLTMSEKKWLDVQSLPQGPLERFHSQSSPFPLPDLPSSIPVVFGTKRGARWIERRMDDLFIHIDIFGAAFFSLTRYEEIVCTARDAHGRFPAAASLAVKEKYERLPIVNVYAEILWGALRSLWPKLQRTERKGRTFVSHDVDWPLVAQGLSLKSVIKSAAGDIAMRRAPLTAARRMAARIAPGTLRERLDPGNTFAFLMDESERRGLSSAFYFIAKNTVGTLDGTYSMDDPFIRRLLRNIHDRGHEIGLHPGYGTYSDEALISSSMQTLLDKCEAEGISQTTWGGRQHYLRWEAPTTWRHWDSAELNYDSTVGYAETVGFRSGSCYEYPVFDVLNRVELRLRERPLIVMEISLYRRTSPLNLAASDTEGLSMLGDLERTVRRFSGDMTLLWHNSSLITAQQRSLYQQALDVLVP